MQFNSYIFILLFFPLFIFLYFLSNRLSGKDGKIVLILAGIVFYSYAGTYSTLIITASIVINYLFSFFIAKYRNYSNLLLAINIVINSLSLFVFKYYGYTMHILGFESNESIKALILPLGISFFSFQQIMFVTSVARKEIEQVHITDYLAFILFFPKLIMGPLMEPVDFINQINDEERKVINWDNIARGIKMFSFGLFKKMVLADGFSLAVNWGFNNYTELTTSDSWLVMIFYTFEIYFDFSGYTDMATGVSSMINIDLPINFDSPYKALSIRDFWKRWHVSLTSFLTKYVYFPLGGNRKGKVRTYVNILIVFLISGIWHGANISFIVWGLLHGLLQVVERIFDKAYGRLIKPIKWLYTFGAVNALWLLFRSDSISQYKQILKKIIRIDDLSVSYGLMDAFAIPFRVLMGKGFPPFESFEMILFTVSAFIICLIPVNNYRKETKTSLPNLILSVLAFTIGLFYLSKESVFVYFNF